AVVRLTQPKMKNLGEKGIDCIFIGYAEHSKCYRFYVIEPNDYVSVNSIIELKYAIFDEERFTSIPSPREPNDYVSVNSIIESRDAIFNDERFTSIPSPRGMIQPSLSKIAEDEVEGTDDVPGPSVPRKSTRTRKAKSFGSDFQLYLVKGTRYKTLSQREYCFIIEEDPRTLSEAMASRDVAFWKEVVQSELDSIMHNDTWKLTDLPPRCKALGCKWILKRISTIRLLLALVAIHDLLIHQMDVKTAFLNCDLDEEIYMKQSEGFVMPGHKSKVCKLMKSLYGLKQAPKQWHQKFNDVVLSNGFSLDQADKCVYSKFNASGHNKYVITFIDDASRYWYVYLLHVKHEALDKFKIYKQEVELQRQDLIKVLRTDRDGEYYDPVYFQSTGIIHQTMAPYTPQQNGVAERKNRTLKEMMNSMLSYSGLKPNVYVSVNSIIESRDAIFNDERFTSIPRPRGMIQPSSGKIAEDEVEGTDGVPGPSTCITNSTMESEFVALAAAGNEAEWLRNLVYEIPLWPNRYLPFLSDVIALLPWLRLIVKCTMVQE
nr:hypothetical protein [Tanacetum cinerariifolium]